MSVQMPKWEKYTTQSYEIPHIFKDPPKAKFTQKVDKISEADVMWMTRPDSAYADPTRLNQNIKYLPRGIDPIAKIKYGSNPYKLQVIRPPEIPVEKLIALSRPRIHQNKSVNTNPGLSNNKSGIDIGQKVDLFNINRITSAQKTVEQRPSGNYYKVEYLDPAIFDIQPTSKNVASNPLFYSASTKAMMRIDQPPGNREYIDDKLADKIKQFNVPALKARPVHDIIVPDLNLISKLDLENIVANQSVQFNGSLQQSPELPLDIKYTQYNIHTLPSQTNNAPQIIWDYDLTAKQIAHNAGTNVSDMFKNTTTTLDYELKNKQQARNAGTNASSSYKTITDKYDYNLAPKYQAFSAGTNVSDKSHKQGESGDIMLDKKVNIEKIDVDRVMSAMPILDKKYEVQIKNAEKYRPMLELKMYQNVNEYTP